MDILNEAKLAGVCIRMNLFVHHSDNEIFKFIKRMHCAHTLYDRRSTPNYHERG